MQIFTTCSEDNEQNFVNLEKKTNTQGVNNCQLVVQIVGGSCFQHHQLAAVYYASLSVFQIDDA
jgi:hypothetical protein